MKSQRLAVGLMIVQAILFAVETAMIHHIGSRGSAMQLALLRSGAGVVLVGLLAWNTGWSVLKTNQLPLQLLRGLVSVTYLWVLMYSFAHIPFADATAISFTQVIYIVVFSALILNERVTTLRWISSVIGTAGALLIVKPAFLDRNTVYLIALIGTSFNGLAFVLNKYLQRPGRRFRNDDNVLRQCRRRRVQSSRFGDYRPARTGGLAMAVRRPIIRARRDVPWDSCGKACERFDPWAIYIASFGHCNYRWFSFIS